MINATISTYTLLPYILVVLLIVRFAKPIYPFLIEMKVHYQIQRLADNSMVLTPAQFFKLRNQAFNQKQTGYTHYSNDLNFAGVYILHNQTKNQYYVGQAKQIFHRVNNHFTGKGNGDVYADYKYGDNWTIRMIALNESPYNTLNELERYVIRVYNSYENGYNKTRGNQ